MKKNCSPNIVEYKGHGLSEKKDVFWIVMEKLEGRSMEENLGISETEALQVRFLGYFDLVFLLNCISLQVGIDICAALKELHALNIINR